MNCRLSSWTHYEYVYGGKEFRVFVVEISVSKDDSYQYGGRSLSFYHGRNCSMTYNHLCSNSYAQSYITSTRFNSEKEHLLLKGLLIIDKIQICEIPTHHIDCNRHFSLTELTSSSSITRYENREQHIYYGLIHDVLRFTI